MKVIVHSLCRGHFRKLRTTHEPFFFAESPSLEKPSISSPHRPSYTNFWRADATFSSFGSCDVLYSKIFLHVSLLW